MKKVKTLSLIIVYLLVGGFFFSSFAQPTITKQPISQGVIEGETATFMVEASGTGTLTYQWKKNGVDIAGATSSSYTTPVTVLSDSNSAFVCVVTDDNGSTNSNTAYLYVTSSGNKINHNIQAKYTFNEGSDIYISDKSGVGSPLTLKINNPENAAWTQYGLKVTGSADIKSSSAATKIISACQSTDEITIEIWVRPDENNVSGLRNIVSNSSGLNNRNFTLGPLDADLYEIRLRTSTSNSNGQPSVGSTSGTVTTDLTHIVYTRNAYGEWQVYINGSLNNSGTASGDFSNWDSNFRLLLAGELGQNLPWLGTYYEVSIYNLHLNASEVSQNYNLGVDHETAPYIAKQPMDQYLFLGETATFEVVAAGDNPLSYQWQKDGVDIAGETSSTLTIANVDYSDEGNYTCVVTNSSGSVTSNAAELAVSSPDQRVTTGVVAQYNFNEGSGTVINDVSGNGTPLNLDINSPSAVSWQQFGLDVNSAASIITSGAATKIYDAVTSSNTLSVEVWVKPSVTSTTSDTRILTISQDGLYRNMSLFQSGDKYVFRLRTTQTNDNGVPYVETSAGAVTGELQHIVYVFNNNGEGILYVDGAEAARVDLGGDLSNWSNSYRLSFANELIDENPWFGSYNYVAIFDRPLAASEVQHNYNFGPDGIESISSPTSVSASATETQVTLTWQDNSDNEDGFVIERSDADSLAFSQVGTTGADSTSFVDATVSEGAAYVYRVKANNSFANRSSAYSDSVSVSTKLFAPTNLSAQATAVGEITLNWEDNSSAESGYIIERGEGNPVVFTVLDTAAANATAYIDNSVGEEVTYTYRVKAFNASSQSDYSNEQSVTSLFSDVLAPTDLTLVANEIGSVTIGWTDNSDNEDGFIIERGSGSPIAYSVLDSVGANVTSYKDSTITDNTEYTYRVKAFNVHTTSVYSNLLTVKTKITPIPAPSNLSISLHSSRGVPELTWQDNSSNEEGFVIERKEAVVGADFMVVDSVGANETYFMDITVKDSTVYLYRIYAFNKDTVSDYSSEKSVEVFTDIKSEEALPTEFTIKQNYPNPFNPSTTIKFGLPEQASVTISIYNLLGQEILKLVDDNFSAGWHTINFDASELTSGIYLYAIQATGENGKKFVETRKMVLLK